MFDIRWANQCIDGHDKNRITGKFVRVGQNIIQINHHRSISIDEVILRLIKLWYAEVGIKDYLSKSKLIKWRIKYSQFNFFTSVWINSIFQVRDVYSSFPKKSEPFYVNNYWFGIDFPSGVIGHFTQLVWHSTFNIGCGFVQTKSKQENRWKSVSI